MSQTPNLQLPFLDANQNQKHVTHNAALAMLDVLVNCGIASAALMAPPQSPGDGQCWIVAAGATGVWAGKPAEDGADATGVAMPTGGAGIRGWLSGLYGKVPSLGRATAAASLPVVLASDQAAVPVTPGKAATAGDASITAGGTAQTLFGGTTPANGWKVANPDPAEDLWVSDSAAAAPNASGSYRLPAGGILTTEPGEKPCGPVSVYGATTGHAITARSW